jgi:hypothetical protein
LSIGLLDTTPVVHDIVNAGGIVDADDWVIQAATSPSITASTTFLLLSSDSLDRVRVLADTGGDVSFLQDVGGIESPSDLALSSDGRFLYITDAVEGTLHVAETSKHLVERFDDGDIALWTDPSNPYADRWIFVNQVDGTPSPWSVLDGVLQQHTNIHGGGVGGDFTYNRRGIYVYYEDEGGECYQWENYELKADLKCTDNDGIGLIFRYADESNYYKLEMDNDEGNGRNFRKLFKVVNGDEETIWTDPDSGTESFEAYPQGEDAWFEVRIRAVGNEIQVFLDGVEICHVTDSADPPLTQGTVAMYCWGQQGAYFDNIEVRQVAPPYHVVQTLREDFLGVFAGANGVAVSPDNKYVYVTGGEGDSLAVFQRDPSGQLQFVQVLRNRRDVGLKSPNSIAVFGLWSTSSLTIFARPSYSSARSSIRGAIILQGAHQTAQKSTNTGTSLLSTSS